MKPCPNCHSELPKSVEDECPACGFNLSNDSDKTLRLDSGAKTIRDQDLVDADFKSSETIRDSQATNQPETPEPPIKVSQSVDETIVEIDDDDDLFSSDTLRDSENLGPEPVTTAAAKTVTDDDELFTDQSSEATVVDAVDANIGNRSNLNDDDDSFLISESGGVIIDDNDNTVRLDPLQTMSRPQIDSIFNSTIPRTAATQRSPGSAPPKSNDNTLKARNVPTIVNPQAALEAAEAYSEGLQSLIPPRTIVRKQDSAEHSDYQVVKRIGAGAFGVVFRARQVPLDRSVAIKLLQNPPDDKALQQRIKNEFLREAQFTGRLEHPNIVPIHDIGLTVSVNGKATPFYVMKEIRGQSWHGKIREKTTKENLEIFKNVVNAVGFAHSQNILHCDLKPDNVMLGEFGEVLVVDWGQAVDLSAPETMRPGGTPAYISPEMAQYWIDTYLDKRSESLARAEVGVRSDVYLLGAILFEIVAGFPPHCKQSEDSPYDVIRRAANNQIVDHGNENDKELMQIALAALRATQGEHLETIEALSDAIEEYENRTASINLRRRADELLLRAQDAEDYDDYQRARFGFEESIQKWNSNQLAIEGLRQSKLSCARQALSDQNFDLGLDVLQGDDGTLETELRNQLSGGKRIRDRRKRMVFWLAAGLAGSILIGLVLNGYMIDRNIRSMTQLDVALKQKSEIEESIAPLQREALEKQQEIRDKETQIAQKQSLINSKQAMVDSKQALIDEFPAKIAKKNAEFNQRIAQKENEFRLKENELESNLAASIVQFNQETAALELQKQKLASQKDQLVGQVVRLNESSKFLRYKSGLNRIQADLDNGQFRDARQQLDKYPNQHDWEIKRLNLYAHREIQSLYPDRPIQAVAFGGEQIAIAFKDKIETRAIADLTKISTSIAHPNATTVTLSSSGDRLFVGQSGPDNRKPGRITIYDTSNAGRALAIETFDAQSGSIDKIEINDNGNLMLAVGKVSPLRQSAGVGLEEPLMVWADGVRVEVDLVLPDGSSPKFNSASFSDSGNRILLTNDAGIQQDRAVHVFENSNLGFQWRASCPVRGVSTAIFTPGTQSSVLAAATDPRNGEHALVEWQFAKPPISQAANSNRDRQPQATSIVTTLQASITKLARNGRFVAAVDSSRRTTVWDWQTKSSLQLPGHSEIADECFLLSGTELLDCKFFTAVLGNQPELLVSDLATFQREMRRKQIAWFTPELPPSVTAASIKRVDGNSVQAFGNDRGTAVVEINGSQTQWNISAWRSHVFSNQFIFAQSNEDFIHVFDRRSGEALRVLTGLAELLGSTERVTEFQVSRDGQVALIQTDAVLPTFLIWNLKDDKLIRKIDYGRQDLFGTGSKKRISKLQLSPDGAWVVGAKVGVYAWATRTGELTRFQLDLASAPRSTANSIVFLRNSLSSDFLVSWRDRVTRFSAAKKTTAASVQFPKISDAQEQANLLDAIATPEGYQLLAISGDDGGIVWMDNRRSDPLANFKNATHASFINQTEIGAIAGSSESNGQFKIQRMDRSSGTVRTIKMGRLQDSIGGKSLGSFEKIDWSPDAGFLLQTTRRNRQSVRRMWNSFSFRDEDSIAIPGRSKILASPVVQEIVTNGKKAATLSSRTLHFWKLNGKGVQPVGAFEQAVSSISLSSDQTLLAVGTPDGRCIILDFETGTVQAQTEQAGQDKNNAVTSIAWHRPSGRLVTGFKSGKIVEVIIDQLNPKLIRYGQPLVFKTQINGPVESLVCSTDGTTLVATVPSQGLALVLASWDNHQQTTETAISHSDDQNIIAADISFNGRRLVTGSDKGQLAVWNIEPTAVGPDRLKSTKVDERLLLRLPNIHQSPVTIAKFADDHNSESVLSAESDAGDNSLILWPAPQVNSRTDH